MSQAQLSSLMYAMRFNQDDLASNQAGQISDPQRERFEPAKVSPLVQMVIVGHALAVAGLLAAIAIATGSAAMWAVVIVVGMLSILPFTMIHRGAITNDLTHGKVAQVSGIAILEQNGSRYKLHIANQQFRISKKIYSSFQNEGDYCVYYLPRSTTLLSAEPK